MQRVTCITWMYSFVRFSFTFDFRLWLLAIEMMRIIWIICMQICKTRLLRILTMLRILIILRSAKKKPHNFWIINKNIWLSCMYLASGNWNVDDNLNYCKYIANTYVITCSWHQKTKPRILQFTNLKCCIKARESFKTPF